MATDDLKIQYCCCKRQITLLFKSLSCTMLIKKLKVIQLVFLI